MKLWILRPVKSLPEEDNPWDPWYDKMFGFVVRAESEEQARRLAQDSAGDEKGASLDTVPWSDAKYSTCDVLTGEGAAGVILHDFAAA